MIDRIGPAGEKLAAQGAIAGGRHRKPLLDLPQFGMLALHAAEVSGDSRAVLAVGAAAILHIRALDQTVQFYRASPDLDQQFHHPLLYQRGTADGLFATNLAALDAAGQIHFLGARQQRNGTDFPQVAPHGIVRLGKGRRDDFFRDGWRFKAHCVVVE